MPSPPNLNKQNPADSPVIMLSLNSDTLNSTVVNEYGETVIGPLISTLNGVSQVEVYGSGKYAVRIQLDPNKLVNRGISLDDVQQAIDRHNANLPTGTLWGSSQAFTVEAKGQLTTADQYKPLIVTYRNGSPVRLEELGEVLDSVQNDKSVNWFNMKRSDRKSVV